MKNSNMDIQFTNDIFNESLILIEENCIQMNNKFLRQLGLRAPLRKKRRENQFLRSHIYDVVELEKFVDNRKQLLNSEQRHVFQTVMSNYCSNTGGIYFLDAPGGTGTYEIYRFF